VKYRITHTTFYNYSQAVGLCQNEAKLQPRDFWRQQCQSSYFEITPTPTDFRERHDFFGNRVAYFAIQQPHKQLTVTAISEVILFPKQNTIIDLGNQLSWEQVRNLLQESPTQTQSQAQNQFQNQSLELLDARQYILDSPMATTNPELADYAKSSFLPNRPLVEVVRDLMQRIYTDFI
jgi:transglutaminase-like putative cysteine protease